MLTKPKHYQTGDQALVRHINLSAILHHLYEHAPVSRAALAEMTGLNKTTVSSLVSELIEHRFVHEVGLESAGTGRPAVLLELNPGAGYMISAEVGVDFLSVICSDFAPEVLWRHHEDISPGMGQYAILNRLLAILHQAADEVDTHDQLLGVALGVPGLVDQQSGTLLFAPNLGWKDVLLRKTLESAFDVPVFVGNEAIMAALGEYFFGAARGHDHVLYISAGVGLGGGIVCAGRVYGGKTGFAGEFGHMTMDPEGIPCNCGNRGCWETQASQPALFRYIQSALDAGHTSILPEMTGGNLETLSISLIVDAARANDAVALEALGTVGRYLGIGIASLVNVLNPDLVVFGGILSLGGEFLLPAIKDALRRRTLRWSREATHVVLAQHRTDACVMGGIATIYQAILARSSAIILQGD